MATSSGNPYQSSSFGSEPPKSSVNGVGIAGFVLSLIGIATCGTLNLLSLPISLLGLLWKPRGLAIAGTIISIVGSGFFVLVGLALVSTFLGLKGGIEHAIEEGKNTAKTAIEIQAANADIENYRAQNNKLPDGIEGNKLVVVRKDAWGKELRYNVTDKGYDIISSGKDKQFDTPDDIHLLKEEDREPEGIEIDGGLGGDGPTEVKPKDPDEGVVPPGTDDPKEDEK